MIRAGVVSHPSDFDPEIGALRAENAFFLKHF
jgi:hypothetical protein